MENVTVPTAIAQSIAGFARLVSRTIRKSVLMLIKFNRTF